MAKEHLEAIRTTVTLLADTLEEKRSDAQDALDNLEEDDDEYEVAEALVASIEDAISSLDTISTEVESIADDLGITLDD